MGMATKKRQLDVKTPFGMVNGHALIYRFSSLPTTQSALQYNVIHPIHSYIHTLMVEASVQGTSSCSSGSNLINSFIHIHT